MWRVPRQNSFRLVAQPRLLARLAVAKPLAKEPIGEFAVTVPSGLVCPRQRLVRWAD